ncbi:hypothetical protein LguiA_036604 [Lonicera macranthoides]
MICTRLFQCAVVTGGNKGIGLEICRGLASNGIRIILTARDEKKGIKAVEELKACGLTHVLFHQLDVKDPCSIVSLAQYIETNFRKLDILVKVTDENAHLLGGIIEQTYEMAEECLKTNYYGTKRVSEALLPLLQLSNTPRIYIRNEKVREELENLENLTEEKVDEILNWFMRDLKEDKLKVNGWPITVSAYKVSKAFINAYTRLLAKKFPNILINCVHPGYVSTYITCHMGYLTANEGAKAPIMVALLPNDGPSGVYFDEMRISTF